MHKQELIDAAEVSGLSRAPIVYVVIIIIMHLDMLIIFLNLFLKLIDDSVSGLYLLSQAREGERETFTIWKFKGVVQWMELHDDIDKQRIGC